MTPRPRHRRRPGLVSDRQPGAVRARGDRGRSNSSPGRSPMHWRRQGGRLRGRLQAGAHLRRRHPPGDAGCEQRRQLHRPDRLDAHLLAGEDVDRRADALQKPLAASAHPGRYAALVRDRHGLHEPEPGRARRPRVRLHPGPAGRQPQDRGGPRRHPRDVGRHRRLGAGGRRRGDDPSAAGGPVRRQHARRRRDRGRQGRGAEAFRRLGEHLRRQRSGCRGRRR